MSRQEYFLAKDTTSGSAEIINVMIVIDTDKLMKDHPKQENPDQNRPEFIGHDYEYMIASNNSAITGSGGADLEFKAYVGDVVRFNMTSEFANFENPVIMYNLEKNTSRNPNDDVFGPFASKVFHKNGVVPEVGNSPLPTSCEKLPFWFYQSDVLETGTEFFNIYFVLYYRERGNPCPQVYGYYAWDPTIIVNS